MRLRTALYELMNAPMRALLRSPLRRIASGTLCLLHYRGRRSGRAFTTPLSYVREDGRVLLLSSRNTRWWLNFLPERPELPEKGAGTGVDAEVEVEIGGERQAGRARTILGGEGDAAADARLREGVRRFLTALPRDARVYGIGLDRQRRPREDEIERRLDHVVLVEVTLEDPA